MQVPEKKGPVPLGDCLALRQRPKLGDMFGRPDRTKASEFGDRVSLATKPSPLEGPASYYGQSAAIDLKKLGRREWSPGAGWRLAVDGDRFAVWVRGD